MSTDSVKRELKAILSADAVGYTRLMAADEVATLDRIKAYRELISLRVTEHRGRVVDSPGDNLLAEFPSALEATRCAVEMQLALKTRNDDLPEGSRMPFRIGIHLGDVMIDDGDIYGEGINIASRLEGLAEPGGICISDIVHQLVKNKMDLDFEDLGEKQMKNVPDPIHVFGINLGFRSSVPIRNEGRSSPSSEKPTIAVLAFENMSSDPEQEYLCEGISEDILNGLARNPGLGVIARTSSFSFKGRNQDVREIGQQLNATHVLEGSIRKAGDRIRVTAQLNTTDMGTHLWSEQYNRELIDVFDIQDDIAGAILEELNVRLSSTGQKRMRTESMDAYDAYLMGCYHFSRQELNDALAQLKKAVLLDPDYADAYGMLAMVNINQVWWGLESIDSKAAEVRECIRRALAINPQQECALLLRTVLLFYVDRDYQDAMDQLVALVRSNPNFVYNLAYYQTFLQTIGDFDSAEEISKKAIETDPLNPVIHAERAINLVMSGRFEAARESINRMVALGLDHPNYVAQVAFAEGNIEDLHRQFTRLQAEKDRVEVSAFWEASVAYYRGDFEGVSAVASPYMMRDDGLPYVRSLLVSLSGNYDLAIELYAQALSESYFIAYREIQAPKWARRLLPDYRSHPKYQQMLRDVGLDEESIAKLRVPTLPL